MDKTAQNEDLRIRRTRKLLQEALIELTVEKGFAAITVRDITERAMVNRSTFYRHYLDKYDLLDQYMDDIYTLIADAPLHPQRAAQGEPEVPAGLLSLLRHIQQHSDFYRVMLGGQGDAKFIERFRQNAEQRYRYLLNLLYGPSAGDNPDLPPLDLRLSYASAASMGAILWWLEQGQAWSPERLAVWIGQLVSASVGLPLKIGVEVDPRPSITRARVHPG